MTRTYTREFREWTKAEEDQLRNLRREGMSMEVVAKMMGRTVGSVRGHFAYMQTRKPDATLVRQNRWDDKARATLVKHMKAGRSYMTISERMNVSLRAIEYAAAKYVPKNVKVRHKVLLDMRRRGRSQAEIEEKAKDPLPCVD